MSRTERFPVPALTGVANTVGWNPMASAYLSEVHNKIIVCPMTSPGRGHYIESDASLVTSFDADPSQIGQAVWESLLQFRSSPRLGWGKTTEWPAYRASGTKSVRRFEDEFVRLSIEAFPCVLRLEAPVQSGTENRLYVGGCISNACEFDELWELMCQVSRGSTCIAEHGVD